VITDQRGLRGPIGEVAGTEPPAAFEDTDAQALLGQAACGHAAAESGADDHHVVCALHYPVLLPDALGPDAIPSHQQRSGLQNMCRFCE